MLHTYTNTTYLLSTLVWGRRLLSGKGELEVVRYVPKEEEAKAEDDSESNLLPTDRQLTYD